jgi:predicted glycosyltransferase
MRVLIWVQHLLGTGHLRRALTLAEAMAVRGLEPTVASGGPPVPWLAPRGVRIEQLPPVRAADIAFSALIGEDGRPLDEALRTARRERLLALLGELRPAAILTEMFPFGRSAFRFELEPLLEAARAGGQRPWILASVRDILVSKPARERYRWMRDLALARYDRILVHADPRLVPFDLTFPFTADLAERLVYTGYVAQQAEAPAAREGRGEVLVSAGGGRVGGRLIEVAIAARALSRHQAVPWRLVDAGACNPAAPRGVILDRQRPDFQALLANCLLSVSQAGYNTVVEALKLGKPMVLVPFATASETEQTIRAERLARLGLAEVIGESELSPPALAGAVDRALDAPRPAAHAFALDGAERSADLIARLATMRPSP